MTEAGWVKPLFLPSPLAVYGKFVSAMTDGVANSTLAEHALASLSRVFGAFFLACLTAIPAGILMGVNRWRAACWTRRSSSTASCRRWPTCRWSSSGSASANSRRSS